MILKDLVMLKKKMVKLTDFSRQTFLSNVLAFLERKQNLLEVIYFIFKDLLVSKRMQKKIIDIFHADYFFFLE